MIFYGCPKCQTPMSSPDSMAGENETCPECGNVAVVPSSQTSNPVGKIPVDIPEVSSPQKKNIQVPASQKEKTLYMARPAMFQNSPVAFILCLVLIPLLGVGLAILLGWWLSCKGTEIRITDRMTTMRRGILSKHTSEVRHVDVRNLRVRQSFFQRLFHVGCLEISTAGQSGMEIVISGIPNPKKAAQLIRERQGT